VLIAVAAAAPARATTTPRLRSLLKAARLVVAGKVTAVTAYDDDRVAVVEVAVERVLKGTLPGDAPSRVALIELHEGPTRPALVVGERGIAFLRPAARTSYLAKAVPPGTYYEVLPDFGAFLPAASTVEAERQVALVERVAAAARGPGMDVRAARQLVFALLQAESPLLVEDAAPGVADLARQPPLSAEETAILGTALQRADLPDRVRIALIESVATAHIDAAVPALQAIDAPPPVVEAAWRALDRLGAGPSQQSLDERLADRDPAVRAAAARELLRRDGVAAVSHVAPLAIQDPDPAVRRAAVDALGALGKPEALPPLERVFIDSPTDLQQATGRAILAVGGPAAVDALGRLAFAGPVLSQRYAVVLLMTMNDPHKTAVLQHIEATHPDQDVRDLVQRGMPFHPD
jgi:HEAT repeat protein